MIRPALAATLVLALTGPAAAEWFSDPGFGGLPYAVGLGTNDIGLVMDCSNGDLPALFVEGHYPDVPDEIFVIAVTGQREELFPADCAGSSCQLDFESMDRARHVIGQLRSGSQVEIGLYRRGFISEISLVGAADAIDAVLQVCPI